MAILFIGCKSKNKSDAADTIKTPIEINSDTGINTTARTGDSIELTLLVKKIYKWHQTVKTKYNGFKPLKRDPSDTLYTSIDLEENKKSIEELKETGFFSDSFLNDYRNIAVRMNKELQDGSSQWPEGELATFDGDADAWCNCQDFPVDDYWNIIKLNALNIINNSAQFKWTWGHDFYYNTKATKENSAWKISYLQGFDMDAYGWGWVTKNKKNL